jgi:protein PhnA
LQPNFQLKKIRLEQELRERSGSVCELCGATENLSVYEVTPREDEGILVCETCDHQLNNPEEAEPNHWRCLNDSMWNPVPAVQVVAWRMLNQLRGEGWPVELLDMMYLDEETLEWAKSGIQDSSNEIKHVDSNGAVLEAGDTVVLIKDLNVKGAGFTAKRGTAVRKISLVHDNPEHIEGRVEGQQIVILTKFVKKSG